MSVIADHKPLSSADEAKLPQTAEKEASHISSDSSVLDTEHADDPRRHSKNIVARFNYYMDKLGGETTGIQRIPEDQRHDESYWDSATMWVSANLGIASYALGALGITTFGMTVRDSMAVIICFSFLGTLPVAAMSTFGPPTGMRQMVMTRYFCGSIGARICAFLTALTCIGWSSANTMSSVKALHTVNHGGLPNWGGILTLSIASLLIASFGYKIVHFYARWAWIPNLLVFFVIAINLGQDHLMDWGTLSKGSTEAGDVLSFGSAVYGYAAGWGSIAMDYTCYKPKNSSKTLIFTGILFWATCGCVLPMLLGCFSAQRTLTSPAYADAYNEQGVGGLLWMVLVEDKLHGFGQVCMVVLSLSVVANNVPNLYSFSMCAQACLPWFEHVPQYVWTCIITGTCIGISIPAIDHFDEYLGEFMDIIGYWISFYFGIVLAEFLIYRRSYQNFNLKAYNTFSKLPYGLAAIFAGCVGVAGIVVGMDQPWFVGPAAKRIGKFGGDVGFEFAFSWGFIIMASTRWIERWIYPDDSYVWGTGDAWWRLGGLFPQSKFHTPQTPEWAPKVDERYKWAAKNGESMPGDDDEVEALVTGWKGKFRRNRGAEEW